MKIKKFTEMTPDVLDMLVQFEKAIFVDPYPSEKFEGEVPRKPGFLLFVAYDGIIPVGYKMGYELSSKLFYSWNGGVIPAHRGKGVAKALMDEQHLCIKELGYETVRTHTKNRYRAMLIFNIKQGFDVIGVYTSEREGEQSIMLEKNL